MEGKSLLTFLLVVICANSTMALTCLTSKKILGECVDRESCESFKEFQTRSSFTQLSQKEQKDQMLTWRCGEKNNLVCCPNDIPYSEPPPSVLGHRNLRLLPEACGKKSLADRLFNAHSTEINEYPWMALISTFSRKGNNVIELAFTCGGTVINSRYILTAAHCITNLTKRELAGVRLGEWDISTERDCVDDYCAPPYQDIFIEEVLPHPGYVSSNKDLRNDIGLLRLASPINLTVANVKPVCLPTTKRMREVNLTEKKLVITGWGKTNDSEKGYSDRLLQIAVPIVSNRECAEKYNDFNTGGVGFRKLCVSGLKGISTCTGDSGGPMLLDIAVKREEKFVQYGVISAGYSNCGTEGQPGILTNVLYYMDWILDTIKP